MCWKIYEKNVQSKLGLKIKAQGSTLYNGHKARKAGNRDICIFVTFIEDEMPRPNLVNRIRTAVNTTKQHNHRECQKSINSHWWSSHPMCALVLSLLTLECNFYALRLQLQLYAFCSNF